MTTYRTELIRKIVRLLESDQQGEVASAAGKLVRMAKEQGHNLDEMLSAVYGAGAGSAKPYQRKSPAGDWDCYGGGSATPHKKSSRTSSWDDAMRHAYAQTAAAHEAAEEARAAKEDFVAKKNKERADKEARAAEEERQRQSKRQQTYTDVRLSFLSHCFDEFGCLPLNKWEGDFVVDILDRASFYTVPTPRQLDIIDEILTKYRTYKKRNGDEQSFWKS
jgi:hypothetical protein